MAVDAEQMRVLQILEQNKAKSFVQRILTPDKYPQLDLGNGDYATHKMAWAEADGKFHVYPTVLYDGKALKQYDPKTAFQQVMKTGNYITFDTPNEADWFSRNYKLAWGRK